MKQRVTPQQIVFALAQSENLTKKRAENFVRSFFELVEIGLREDKLVKIKNFGTFKVTEVSERESVNIQTGERFQIDSHSKITFLPDTLLKEKVNKPFSQFQTVVLADDVDEKVLAEADEKAEPVTEVAPPSEQPSTTEPEKINKAVDAQPAEEIQPEPPAQPVVTQEEEQVPATSTQNVQCAVSAPETPKPEEEPPSDDEPEVPSQEETPELPDETLPSEEPATSDDETNESLPTDYLETELDDENMTTHKSNHRLGIAFGLLFGALLLCGAYLAGYYNILHLNLPPISPKAVTTVTNDSVEAKADTTDTAPAPVADVYDNHVNYEQIPGADFLIVGELEPYTMKKGDGLYMLAKRVYGDKEFARYIIFYNKLKNPDNVPVGTELKMPELRKKRQ